MKASFQKNSIEGSLYFYYLYIGLADYARPKIFLSLFAYNPYYVK